MSKRRTSVPAAETVQHYIRKGGYRLRPAALAAHVKYDAFRHWCRVRKVYCVPMFGYHTDEEILELGESLGWQYEKVGRTLGRAGRTIKRAVVERGLGERWGAPVRGCLANVTTEVLRSLYEQGVGGNGVARRFGVHQDTAIDELRRRGIKINEPKEAKRLLGKRIDAAIEERYGHLRGMSVRHVPTATLREMRENGVGIYRMAVLFGYSKSTILGHLDRRGIRRLQGPNVWARAHRLLEVEPQTGDAHACIPLPIDDA